MKTTAFLTIIFAFLLNFHAFSQQSMFKKNIEVQQKKEMIRGGALKDLILPAPIVNGLESEGIWGGENVLPRDKDNGMEDNEWSYWGGNPIKGKDGKYHIAVCRWPESEGHMGWFESEVAHCVSDDPIGPYVITQTVVKSGHNPEVMKMKDGSYAMHLIKSEVYTADKMAGPWKFAGNMTMDPRGLRSTGRLGSNLTTEYRPDESILLMTKGGDIAVSTKGIMGPYNLVSIHNYKRNSGYAEDPVIWRSRHQYHCIYNHAQNETCGYMRSLDGVHWKNEEGFPYDFSGIYYTDGTKNVWHKYERPKVMQDELGRITHLSLAVIDSGKGEDKGNDNHSSKNVILPMVVERLVTVLNKKQVTPKTKIIKVKIEAEEGFDPLKDIDIPSLRFGSDSKVNYGEGCLPILTKNDGKDLIVHFKGENGLNRFDFDFKLLGSTKKGDLVVGYALLPQKSPLDASLVALPIKIDETQGRILLESIIENIGLSVSKPTKAVLYEHSKYGWREVGQFELPMLKPYENHTLSMQLDNSDWKDCEYEIRIVGQDNYDGSWRMVDDTDDSVQFSDGWTFRTEPDSRYYMNNERITNAIGNSVKFTFNGCKARVYGTLESKMGSFDVYIDGEYIENIRLNWGGAFCKLYQTELLPEGTHTLELITTEFRGNIGATIDAFSYESPANRNLVKQSKK